jgi:hypothetical protein
MSGTADNGTTFGAAIDLDENAAGVGTNDAGVAIFISGDLGTLTLGDTDGALDWAMQEVDFNGARVDQRRPHHARRLQRQRRLDGHYDGQILRYDYSFGDFSVAVSVEQDDNTTAHGGAFGRLPDRWPALGGRCSSRLTPTSTADPIWGLGMTTSSARNAASSA